MDIKGTNETISFFEDKIRNNFDFLKVLKIETNSEGINFLPIGCFFANHIPSMSSNQTNNNKKTNNTNGNGTFKKVTNNNFNGNGYQKKQSFQDSNFKKNIKTSKTLYIGKISNHDLER